MKKLNAAVRAVLGEVGQALIDKAEEKPAAPKPDGRATRDMRCKHVDARGKRCPKRSKGPRFNYRCDAHKRRRKAARS